MRDPESFILIKARHFERMQFFKHVSVVFMNELSKINSLLLYFPRIQSIIVDQMNITEQEKGFTDRTIKGW